MVRIVDCQEATEHRCGGRTPREDGPALGRPVVDSIKGSRHSNMKELRAGTLRVLFAFDPSRTAVLLLGGDKRDRWQQWYREAIPEADDLLEEHLQRVR